MAKKINLNDPEIMSAKDASELWGKQKDYVRTIWHKYPERFPKDSIRKIDRTILVTRYGMEQLTGIKFEDLNS